MLRRLLLPVLFSLTFTVQAAPATVDWLDLLPPAKAWFARQAMGMGVRER